MSLSHGMMCRNLRNSQFSNCSRTLLSLRQHKAHDRAAANAAADASPPILNAATGATMLPMPSQRFMWSVGGFGGRI
jgi:hypothetical protein